MLKEGIIDKAEYELMKTFKLKILEEKGELKGYLEVPGVIHGFVQIPSFFPESAKAFEWISKFYS